MMLHEQLQSPAQLRGQANRNHGVATCSGPAGPPSTPRFLCHCGDTKSRVLGITQTALILVTPLHNSAAPVNGDDPTDPGPRTSSLQAERPIGGGIPAGAIIRSFRS